VSGSTSGSLTLEQDAYAGDAGGANGANGGTGGNATSDFTLSPNTGSSITATSVATGGAGSTSQNATGSAGGTATSQISLSSSISGLVTATAASNYYGGGSGYSAGGNFNSGTGNGGPGAAGTALSTADDTGSGPADAYAYGYGGDGGNGIGSGFTDGNGANGSATATAITVSGQAIAFAQALGGSGGTPNNSASAGTVGTGTATAITHGITATDFVTNGGNAQTGGLALAEVDWVSGIGATVYFGPGGDNIGQGTVTGTMAYLNVSSGSGSITVGNGGSATLLKLDGTNQSTGNIIVTTNSAFDISINHFYIDYGSNSDPISTIYSYLKSGYNNGSWNGTGIISSSAQVKTDGLAYGVGWADGNDGTHNVAGLSSGSIELKYTLLGDANLDGSVNGSDFSILAANFGLGVTNWDQGNFLYSSSVNGSDFSALAANFGQGDSGADVNVSPADIAALDAFAAANGLPAPLIGAVPEPATMGIILVAGVGILGRRRRRQAIRGS
jgi:hypothetical protein